jgi:spore germination protein KC
MRPICCILVMVLVCASVAGCWNRREPELLAVVIGAAFDYDPESRVYRVIAQVANPVGSTDAGDQGGGQGFRLPFWVSSAEGQTPFEAMRNLAYRTSREMYWAHNRVVLVSERLAVSGIGPVLDLFERERQMRSVVVPVVVRGDIDMLMQAEFPFEEVGTRAISTAERNLLNQGAAFPVQSLTMVYRLLDRPGQEVLMGAVTVVLPDAEPRGDGQSPEAGPTPAGQMPVEFGGAACFDGDRLSGWLDALQVEGIMIVTNRLRRAIYTVNDPLDESKLLTVELLNISSEICVECAADDMCISIRVRAVARLQNMTNTTGLEIDPEYVDQMEQLVADKIKQRTEDAIRKAQELGTDVLGLGHHLHTKRPRLWRDVEHNWKEIFANMPVEVNAKVNVARPGLVVSPLTSGGGISP